MENKYAITYDVGTTGVKCCVFALSDRIEILGSASAGYRLYVLPDGGAEQEPDEWWSAMCETTASALEKAGIPAEKIEGISFCSQMQGLVLVDKDGKPVHRAMSYMDQRAREELKKGMAYGAQIAGANIPKLLKSLRITGAVAASVKDPVWKYKWIEAHEPENFARAYKWLDVKEYLICRMTGRCVMTYDSAFSALLYDIHKKQWSREMCDMLGVNFGHLPELIASYDKVGELREQQAAELGLRPGTAVFGGGGDASLIGVGAGAVELGDTHVYSGTSGWVSTVTDRSVVDTSAMIAAIVGADADRYNYFAELETAGKCLEWVKDHLALDEIGIYLQKTHVADEYEGKYTSLYDYMTEIILRVSDVMRTGDRVAVVAPETPVLDTLLAMTKAQGGSAVVADADGKLMGIFTDGDFRRAFAGIDGKAALGLSDPVSAHMTRNPLFVNADAYAAELLRIFETRRIDDLPVCDADGKVLGLVDIQDLPKLKVL